jgi:hypothetical protein
MGDSVLSVSAAIHPNVHSPEDVFRLYRGRRAGIVQALTEGLSLSFVRVDFGAVLFSRADRWLCLFAGFAVRRRGGVLRAVRPW